MTLVTGTVQDLGYDGMDGTLWARPARFRSDGSVVYAPERKPYKVVDGAVSADLAPGPAVLELQVGSHARGTFEVVIPEEDTTLADLLDTVFPWEPAQISLFVAEREAAEQAAADAETAAGQAATAAQQTGQDRTHVDQVRTELDEAFDESTAGNVLPPRLTESALNATYQPVGDYASTWRPGATYKAGQRSVGPEGLVQAKTAFTSGAVYDPMKWNRIQTFAPAPGETVDPNAASITMPPNPGPRLVTPDGSGDVTHPSVLRVPGGWNGHEYWLAITPMPGSQSEHENPCVYYSDNGTNWHVPAGLTNPIEGKPGTTASDYNSDTHLVLDGQTMRVFWRQQVDGQNYYIVRSSTDGVDWSDREVIYGPVPLASEAYYSACFNQTRDGSWHMHALNGRTYNIEYRTSPSFRGPWSPATVTSVRPVMPAGKSIWHMDVKVFGNDFHMLLVDTATSGAPFGDLYFARCQIGSAIWQRGTLPLVSRRGGYWDYFYRSCMVPAQRNGRFAYEVYAATFAAQRNITRTWLEFGTTREAPELSRAQVMLAAKAKIAPYRFADTFNRADGAIGTAETGQTWIVIDGVASIVGGRAHPQTAYNTVAVIDSGLANMYVEGSFTSSLSPTDQWYLVFRRVDATNYWRFGNRAGRLALQKIVGGVATDLLPAHPEPHPSLTFEKISSDTIPVRLGVRCRSQYITLFVNGQQYLAPFQDSANSAGVQHGWQASTTSAWVDDIYCRELSAGEM